MSSFKNVKFKLFSALGIFLYFILITNITHASTPDDELYCPINGSIDIYQDMEIRSVANDFDIHLKLINNTNYVMGDVGLVLALYSPDNESVPLYWTKVSAQQIILPGKEKELDLYFTLEFVPKGEYVMKIVPVQGDGVNLFGDFLLKDGNYKGTQFIKNSEADRDMGLSILLNDSVINDENSTFKELSQIKVDIQTKNEISDEVLDGEVIGVVTQGQIPVGAALYADVIDKVTLVPNGERKTILKNENTLAGKYTAYAAFAKDLSFTPIKSVVFNVGNDDEKKSWPYISKLGISDYPINSETKVVACIDYVGEMKGTKELSELLAIDFSLVGSAGELMKEKKFNDESDLYDYFIFSPKINIDNFTLNADLLQQRFPYIPAKSETGELIDVSHESLFVVSRTVNVFNCLISDFCTNQFNDSANQNYSNNSEKNSPWFYIGIIVASLLLIILILIKTKKIDLSKFNTNEIVTKKE